MSNAPERTPSDYPVLLRSLPAVDGGGYLAMVPDLPRCVSDGDTTCSGVRERAGGDRGIATAVRHRPANSGPVTATARVSEEIG